MSSYSQKYYELNKKSIILKNVERQSKSETYKKYQREYYLKYRKKTKQLTDNEKWLVEYNKKVKKSEYYKDYYENKIVKNKIDKSLSLIL
jgi:hypothetical protein